MSTSPHDPSLAQPSLLRRLLRAFPVCIVAFLTLASVLLCLTMEIENTHFDTFFPRRYEFKGARHLYPFFPTRIIDHDASAWPGWQMMLTGDQSWCMRPLTPGELQQAQRWADDAPRWDQFVRLIRVGSPIQLGLIVGIWFLGWLLCHWVKRQRHPAAWWTLSTCMALATIIAIDMVFRGWFSAFKDSYPSTP